MGCDKEQLQGTSAESGSRSFIDDKVCGCEPTRPVGRSRMTGTWIALVLFAILSYNVVLITTGHSRWAGETLITTSGGRGINRGDVLPALGWLVGCACCLWVWRNRDA